MPHIPVHPSAEKRHRQSLKRAVRNRAVKSRVRSAVKKAGELIASADQATAEAEVRQVTKLLHKAATKGTIHRNTASRKAGRLAKRLHRQHASASATSEASSS